MRGVCVLERRYQVRGRNRDSPKPQVKGRIVMEL